MEQPHYIGTLYHSIQAVFSKVAEDHPTVDIDAWIDVCGKESIQMTQMLVDSAGVKNCMPNFWNLLRLVFETSIPKTTIASLSQRKEG